jgi:hypothetical protein
VLLNAPRPLAASLLLLLEEARCAGRRASTMRRHMQGGGGAPASMPKPTPVLAAAPQAPVRPNWLRSGEAAGVFKITNFPKHLSPLE